MFQSKFFSQKNILSFYKSHIFMLTKSTLGVYIRVSTLKQAEKGLSADLQLKQGIDLAKQLGWDYKIYDDRGVSGSKVSYNDRNLGYLIKDCQKKTLSGIYCVDIDRWSRDSKYTEGQVIITLIKESNVRVFTQSGEINFNDVNTELMQRIKSLFASFEVKTKVNRIKDTLKTSAENGRVKGGAHLPYGYKKGENKMMIIDEYEAKIVREIYQLANEGKGTKVIAGILNSKRYPTKSVRNGKSMKVRGEQKTEFLWRDKVVYDILTNSIYKGERKHKGEIFKAPIIIDAKLFDYIQDELKSRNQFKDTTNRYDFLLKGLIECPICGSKIQGKKRANGKDNCYTCTSNRIGPNCGNRGINIEYLDDLVCSNIRNLDLIIEEAFTSDEIASRTKDYKKQLKAANERIKQLEREQETLIDLASRTRNNNAVAKKLDIAQSQLDKAIELKEAIEKELSIDTEKDALISVATEGIKHFRKLRVFDDKVSFIRSVIEKIKVEWVSKEKSYHIQLFFRLNKLQQYLITKDIVVNRNGRKGGKAVSVILSEKVTINHTINVDVDNNVNFTLTEANYSPYLNNHTLYGSKKVKFNKATL